VIIVIIILRIRTGEEAPAFVRRDKRKRSKTKVEVLTTPRVKYTPSGVMDDVWLLQWVCRRLFHVVLC
jgi:UTP:GlnB (protein PII) uridylyltransferase